MTAHKTAMALMLCLAPVCFAASFDCTKARSTSDKTICATPRLSKLDDALAIVYEEVSSKLPPISKKELWGNEGAWLAEVRKCENKVECIADEYSKRMAMLLEVKAVQQRLPVGSNSVKRTPLALVGSVDALESKSHSYGGLTVVVKITAGIEEGLLEDQVALPLSALDAPVNVRVYCHATPTDRTQLLRVKKGQEAYVVALVPTGGTTTLRQGGADQMGLYHLDLEQCAIWK